MKQEHHSSGLWAELYNWRLPARSIPMLFVLSLVLAISVGPIVILKLTGHADIGIGHIIGSLILGYMFAGVPILVCLTQNDSQKRQLEILDAYSESGIGRTRYFRQALLSVRTFSPAAMTAEYFFPMVVFFWITVFAIVTIFLAFSNSVFNTPSVVLGGIHVGSVISDEGTRYQMGTFAVGAAAFFGAYAYVTHRLIERTMAADLYPAVFYKYSAHILIACSVAGVLRLGLSIGGIEKSDGIGLKNVTDASLTIVGFIVGRFPDLFIGRLVRNISGKFRFLANRPEIDGRLLPAALSLQLLDDIKQETIDRLAELQIFSAFELATRNPVLIWLKTPHELSEIVGWLAQAQLLMLVREVSLAKMRLLLIRDIFDLVLRLRDQSGNSHLMAQLSLQDVESSTLVKAIESSEHFTNLIELREALKV